MDRSHCPHYSTGRQGRLLLTGPTLPKPLRIVSNFFSCFRDRLLKTRVSQLGERQVALDDAVVSTREPVGNLGIRKRALGIHETNERQSQAGVNAVTAVLKVR